MQESGANISNDFEKLMGRLYSSSESTLSDCADQSTASDATTHADQNESIPEQVGRYKILGTLGTGGLGLVLRAMDERLNRQVAVKVLRRRHLHKAEMRAQFLREGIVTAQLEHPGVIPIYETGVSVEDLPFFAMRILKGSTLSSLLSEKILSSQTMSHASISSTILKAFEVTCDTIAYAHTQQIIHHDVKPDNIMTHSFGTVKVLDWGFATTPKNRTASLKRIYGTPAYMAREQARGQVNTDGRCDIFSLGAILCEILTGAPPYRGETQHEIYLKARIGSIGDAYQRLDTLTSDTTQCPSKPLVDITRRCLNPDPNQRPSCATDLADATRVAMATYLDKQI